MNPEYPRRLAGRLHRGEAHVAQRLRTLEQAGLLQGSWVREGGKNVKLYRLKTREFTLAINEEGYQVQAQTTEIDTTPYTLEGVPPRCPIFGREQELARLSDPSSRFSMIVGLPGMGKTTLATELAHRHGIQRVVWHTFAPFDSALRLLGVARRWLAFLDPSRSHEYERANWDISDLLDRVTDGLSRHRTLIILDDYQKIRDDSIHEIVRRWQRTLESAKVVVLSRNRPPFDLDTTPHLITLPGLDRAAALGLLKEFGLTASSAEFLRLERAFGGHPLSLRLYAQQPDNGPGAARSVGADVGREAFHALDGSTQHVLLALACVRRPLGLIDIRFLTGLREPSLRLAVLEVRLMIRSEGLVYRIHDVLRDSLSSTVASHPEIHRRATALFLPSERGDDIVEALYHATKAEDWSVAGNLLELDLAGEREMPSTSVNAAAVLEILDEIPPDKIDARHREMLHRGHALAMLGIAKTPAVIRELETARQIADPLGDPRLLSWVLSPLGYYLANTGRMAAAERVLARNLRIVESTGSLADKADALLMLALLYDRQGNRMRAKECWRRALEVARQTGNRRLVLELWTWHVAFPSNWRQMLPRLRRWRADFRRWEMPRQVEAVDILSGEILCREERYRAIHRKSDLRRAIRFFERAITGCEAIGNRYDARYAHSWLFLGFFLGDEYERGGQETAATLVARPGIGPGHCAILCHQVLSRLSRLHGDMDGAREHSDIAVRQARRMNCGCVGIASLERAVLDDGSGNEIALRELLEPAVAETIQRGCPDEVRYARRLARQHHAGLPPKTREIGTPSGQPDTAPLEEPGESPSTLTVHL